MAPEANRPRRSFAAIALAVAGLTVAGGLLVALASPAQAQLFERRQRQAPEVFNPFRIFTPLFQREPREQRDPRDVRERKLPGEPRSAPVADHSKAPPPQQKSDAAPSKRIFVMGASLSDWLAYGLEDIYSDQPDVGVVRKNHVGTGLVRFDSKDESNWPKVAREFLKDQNPDVIVVMLGLEDRVAIRERPAARDAQPQGDAKPAIAAPESRRQTAPAAEFRSEQWAEAYAKRIDDMIAALRSKGVPVIWVGLPAIRGTRSTSDMIYLNDLFRARAERAGIIYVDVWDGFVDESGRYTNFGPDVEGQARRLRTAEGVYFTNPGARKLAHYVDREIKRVMGTKLQPMAIPTLDESGQPTASRPGEPESTRPVAGPVVSLTEAAGANELLGGATKSGVTDPLAVRVLVNGAAVAPPSGRADNFFLTPEAVEAARAAAAVQAATPLPAALSAAVPAAASAAAAIIADEPKAGEQAKPDRPAKRPVAGADPASAAAPRGTAPSRPGARTADGRTQPPNRPAMQKLRPNTPRDLRAAERRPPPRQRFDPLGLFR